MEKDRKRAVRRHHIERLKKSRAHYFVVNWWGEEYKTKRLGMVVQYPRMCSCRMCGNARKYDGEITIQEKRHLDILKDGIDDVFGEE